MELERLEELEKTCEGQAAEIAALQEIVADLLCAYSVKAKDVRLIRLLGDDFRHNRELAERGGTTRTSASYFFAKCDGLGTILEHAFSSRVLYQFWFPSIVWKKEKRQKELLERIRTVIGSQMSK